MNRICLVPRLNGVGGMVSFQYKLSDGLKQRGFDICYELKDKPYQAVLVIGGSRQLSRLWQARHNGARLVQRLDGMNWIHRHRWTSFKHFIRAETSNWLIEMIRRYLAEHIVYQSRFSQTWWERIFGKSRVNNTIIYNGINLEIYTPDGKHNRPDDSWRLLVVEGSLTGGYEIGLEMAVQFGLRLHQRLIEPEFHSLAKPVELMVVGRVENQVREKYNHSVAGSGIRLLWGGLVRREEIPEIDRSAHLLFSTAPDPACPNSVIEAMGCGLPVVAFDTGALPELVQDDAGRIVPYKGNPWKLEMPDIDSLARVSLEILQNQAKYRQAARQRAVSLFGLDAMVNAYSKVLLDG